jgi:integrase
MPYEDVATFIAKLRAREATASLALELCILTAARSGEILGMQWSEIDIDKKIWTVPANRMKAGREHRVPLSSRAVAILKQLKKARVGEFVFPGQARNKPLSNMAMEMMLRRMKVNNATVHGFRSSFRDWAGNVSNFPREVVETALAHVIGDKAEQAYRRSDALEKRRQLMDAWAAYCLDSKARVQTTQEEAVYA